MIHIEKEQNCCGCTACVNICSHKAIEMKPDALGFMYPRVDTSLCVDCGLCERICSFNDNYSKEHILLMPKAFAARHKSIKEIENSRSGAAFVALSDWILSQNGIIYGVGFRDHFRVVHKRAICKNERDEFRGSKYVQSDLGAIFKLVENDLKCKKTVLFSGTPCQVAGLLAFIPKKLRDNLYTIDIVCHGVPSPYIWRDYLYYLEKKVGKHFEKVNFRDKSKGWTSHKESYVAGNKIYYSSIYTDLFYKHIIFRPSCGICYFANLKHPADITLADFWGWEHNCPD